METTHYLAMLFGPFLAILGLWAICYTDQVIKIITSLKNTPAALYIHHVLGLFMGLLILALHSSWRWHLGALVTLLGWVYILRAILGLYLPQLWGKWASIRLKWFRIWAWLPLIWGLLLCWLAFQSGGRHL